MAIFNSMKSLVVLIALVALGLSGCSSQRINTKSSVMEYLYPTSENFLVATSTPHLKLPLRVGVAFVPESSDNNSSNNIWTGKSYSGQITEFKKNQILERVSDNFRELKFVSSIEVIPSAYLTPGGSFSNISQIKTMYGIDVIALVSYDQVQFTDEGALSLSYWTIVGAYLVSGEKNDTSTLMDTVVYDIESKSMLFRAPGTSRVLGKSTLVNLSEELRADSIKGFEDAADDMVINLKNQLSTFQERIKENPEKVKISNRDGAGSLGVTPLIILLLLLVAARLRKYYGALN
ncbi:rhombotarget lipoprotein [Marinomonas sp. PE14-40]|uniref:rhombotarget lipoprotein n=1 Tax=Marinomonas sp. PE14-40 TaxID=3060621 RepID=UPI003F6780EA